MLTFLTILGIYFGGMILFALLEAYVGFKDIEFDGGAWPPLGLAYGFWFLALPIATIASMSHALDGVRDARITKAKEQKRIRIAAQKEHEALMEQVEQEMLEEESPKHVKAKGAHRR